MAFKVVPHGVIRDKAYPSQIAAERPLGATRIHCEVDEADDFPYGSTHLAEEALRGGEQPMHTERMSDRFNRQLREGHGGRNSGEE